MLGPNDTGRGPLSSRRRRLRIDKEAKSSYGHPKKAGVTYHPNPDADKRKGIHWLWKILFPLCLAFLFRILYLRPEILLFVILASLVGVVWHHRDFIYWAHPFSIFWEYWTVQSSRVGWQSFSAHLNSNDQPQFRHEHKSDQPTSRLCDECLRVVNQSGLLSGSIFMFVRRNEFHDWRISSQASTLNSARVTCHLCSIFRNSFLENTAGGYGFSTNDTPHDQNGQIEQQKIKIWEERNPDWYKRPQRFMQVYRGRQKLTSRLEITEGMDEMSPGGILTSKH